jgi:hypothetical protein
MPDRQLRITREGVELGTLAEVEVHELIELGLLKPSDLVSGEGINGSEPLSEWISSSAPTVKRSWFATARDSVSQVASAAASSAGQLAEKAKSLATVPPNAVSAAASKFLDGCTAQIEKALASVNDSRPMRAIRAGVRDDETMTKVFGAAYDVLPRPVCRFISEERFIAYCMQHRARLLHLPESRSEGS